MSRLIDADAFIEKLGHVPMVQEAIKRAMDTMPTIEPEQRWIPVEERLPEVGQDVLFSVQDLFVSEGCLRDDGDWSQFRWQAIQKKESVTAWMTLPEPYQKKR